MYEKTTVASSTYDTEHAWHSRYDSSKFIGSPEDKQTRLRLVPSLSMSSSVPTIVFTTPHNPLEALTALHQQNARLLGTNPSAVFAHSMALPNGEFAPVTITMHPAPTSTVSVHSTAPKATTTTPTTTRDALTVPKTVQSDHAPLAHVPWPSLGSIKAREPPTHAPLSVSAESKHLIASLAQPSAESTPSSTLDVKSHNDSVTATPPIHIKVTGVDGKPVDTLHPAQEKPHSSSSNKSNTSSSDQLQQQPHSAPSNTDSSDKQQQKQPQVESQVHEANNAIETKAKSVETLVKPNETEPQKAESHKSASTDASARPTITLEIQPQVQKPTESIATESKKSDVHIRHHEVELQKAESHKSDTIADVKSTPPHDVQSQPQVQVQKADSFATESKKSDVHVPPLPTQPPPRLPSTSSTSSLPQPSPTNALQTKVASLEDTLAEEAEKKRALVERMARLSRVGSAYPPPPSQPYPQTTSTTTPLPTPRLSAHKRADSRDIRSVLKEIKEDKSAPSPNKTEATTATTTTSTVATTVASSDPKQQQPPVETKRSESKSDSTTSPVTTIITSTTTSPPSESFALFPCHPQHSLVVWADGDGKPQWKAFVSLLKEAESRDIIGKQSESVHQRRQLQLTTVPGALNLHCSGLAAPFVLSPVTHTCVDRCDGPYHLYSNAAESIPGAAGILARAHNVVRACWRPKMTVQIRLPGGGHNKPRGVRYWVAFTNTNKLKELDLPEDKHIVLGFVGYSEPRNPDEPHVWHTVSSNGKQTFEYDTQVPIAFDTPLQLSVEVTSVALDVKDNADGMQGSTQQVKFYIGDKMVHAEDKALPPSQAQMGYVVSASRTKGDASSAAIEFSRLAISY